MNKWMKLLIIGMAAIALIAIFKLSLSGVQKTVSTFLDSNLAMLLAGTAMHFLMGLSALQKEASLTLSAAINQQWTTRSADVLLGVIGAFAGYALISEMNMLNAASALGAGYMSDSIANAAAERNRKIVTGAKP